MNFLVTDACWRQTWTVHSKCAVRKALTFWFMHFLHSDLFSWDAVPNPVHGCCNAAARRSRIWGHGSRSIGTHSFPSAQQWVLGSFQAPPLLLGFFPTKGILEWFHILLWNPYTVISQYVYLKECKWFHKTGWQNSISSCCTAIYGNYCEMYFRWRENTTTL